MINRRTHGEWGALSQTNNSIALLPKVIIVYIDGLKCVYVLRLQTLSVILYVCGCVCVDCHWKLMLNKSYMSFMQINIFLNTIVYFGRMCSLLICALACVLSFLAVYTARAHVRTNTSISNLIVCIHGAYMLINCWNSAQSFVFSLSSFTHIFSFTRSMGRFKNNRAHNKWVFIQMSCLTISFIFLLMIIYVILHSVAPNFKEFNTKRDWHNREHILRANKTSSSDRQTDSAVYGERVKIKMWFCDTLFMRQKKKKHRMSF